MGQLDNETTSDDFEGSVAPLGRSRRACAEPSEGLWTPVIRKAVAVVLGGVALSAIGLVSMAHHPSAARSAELLKASVPGAEPLEWLALNASSTPAAAGQPESVATGSESSTALSTMTASSSSGHSQDRPTQSGILPDGRVVLNLATASELTTLPGIGQKRAESIVALRQRLGGFKKLADLLRVKGIGAKSLRKLEPKITLNPPRSE